MHTIDPGFILGIARVSAFGARKYHMRNFLMAPGMAWSKVYDSAMRHLMLYWAGEELDVGPNGEFGETDDPETNMKWSGLPHIDMVAWNVMVLCTYRNHEAYGPGDDRPSVLEHVGGIWREWESEFAAVSEIDAKPEMLAEEKELPAATDTPASIVAEMSQRLHALGYGGSIQQYNNRITISINPADLANMGPHRP